jgi:large subunit ribosomal protein L32
MPNPKRRHSHQRSAKRRTHYTATLPELQPNKQVGGDPFHLRHNATEDGYYKGRRLPGYKDPKRKS